MAEGEPTPFSYKEFSAAMGYHLVPPALEKRRRRVCLALGMTLSEFESVQALLFEYLPYHPKPDELLKPAAYYEQRLTTTLKALQSNPPQSSEVPEGFSLEQIAQDVVDAERRSREAAAAVLRADRPIRAEAIGIIEQIYQNMKNQGEG